MNSGLIYSNCFESSSSENNVYSGFGLNYYEKNIQTNTVWDPEWEGMSFAFWISTNAMAGDPSIITNKNWSFGGTADSSLAVVRRMLSLILRMERGIDTILPFLCQRNLKATGLIMSSPSIKEDGQLSSFAILKRYVNCNLVQNWRL